MRAQADPDRAHDLRTKFSTPQTSDDRFDAQACGSTKRLPLKFCQKAMKLPHPKWIEEAFSLS